MRPDTLDENLIKHSTSSANIPLTSWVTLAGTWWYFGSAYFVPAGFSPGLWTITFLLIIVSGYFLIKQEKPGVVILSVILLVATFVNFPFLPFRLKFGLFGLFSLELIPLFLLAILLASRKELVFSVMDRLMLQPPAVAKSKGASHNYYTRRFRKKSTAELERMLRDKALVPEAEAAARMVIGEREGQQAEDADK